MSSLSSEHDQRTDWELAAIVSDAAEECARQDEDNDVADREYLVDCLGRNPSSEEWAMFTRDRATCRENFADERARAAEQEEPLVYADDDDRDERFLAAE